MKKTFLLAAMTLAASTPALGVEIIVNGDFETGDYTGWNAVAQTGSNGTISLNAPGANAPNSGSSTVANPLGGNFYSLTDQSGPGAYSLSQLFALASGTSSAILSFQMFANNYNGDTIVNPAGFDFQTAGPNQHSRVDILTGTAGLFSTDPLDIVANLYLGADAGANPNPYTSYTFDLLSLGLTSGSTYLLRFAQVDNQFFFNQGVDNVSIDAQVGAVPEPASWAMMIIGFGLIGGVMRRKTVKVSLAHA